MKNRIIEICELGQPQSIIHRENEPITELINTEVLIKELNQAINYTRCCTELKEFKDEFIEAWEDGSGGDSDLYRKAKNL